MGDPVILDAPQIRPMEPRNKWEREYRAFQEMLPELLKTYRGQYVAIHEGQVVESGDVLIDVAMAAQAKVGYVPIHVGLVTDQPLRPVVISGPRLLRPLKAL